MRWRDTWHWCLCGLVPGIGIARARALLPGVFLLGAAAVRGATPEEENARYEGRYAGKELYTPADPEAGGGIQGCAARPRPALRAVFALPPDDPAKVYRGRVGAAGEGSFSVTGLPVGKYDVVLVADDAIYEGLRLHRGASTLAAGDEEAIRAIIDRSEPFFPEKAVHRMAGAAGRGAGVARALCTYVRRAPSLDYMAVEYRSPRRALKLVLLEDVGPGWQIARTREVYSLFVAPDRAQVPVRYCRGLSEIRVIDRMKDLGELNLDRGQ